MARQIRGGFRILLLTSTSTWQRKDDSTKDAATRDRDYHGIGRMYVAVARNRESAGQQDLSSLR